MRHRLLKGLKSFFQTLISAVVRAVVTTLVFSVCVLGLAHFMGVPLPSPDEVLRDVEGISKLAKALS